ncbi:cytochrome c oxidase subunit 4 [Agromyces sp. CFH 90414]|uniref:Cytochrome c oxidase polypeptide 4 n=1 Tax=Agromyces agglutinans TaxID=2662258 RepID=A0A6I2F3T5_9MICO|nr:cytochrome c oxidase subunit 4 [Agromyces agglutinans]MRG58377.1 cytochrome c oxidase subunit 4 [Agromyces agglutinans]
MRANVVLFWILAAFFALAAAIYIAWTIIDAGEPEWVGLVAISLSAVLAAFIAFYLGRVHSAQGGALPEDRLDANIDDGDPELGFFSPWSWWPIMLAAGAALLFLGLAVGFWISFIAVPIGIISLVGWVYEYYRGNFAR